MKKKKLKTENHFNCLKILWHRKVSKGRKYRKMLRKKQGNIYQSGL